MSRKKLPISEIFPGIKERIKKIRGNLTQNEFGRILGVTKATISRYESGRFPDANTLKKIAEFGGVPVEWILHDEILGPSKYSIRIQEPAPETYQDQKPEPLEAHLLFQVMSAIEEFMKIKRRPIPQPHLARLISKVYNHCIDTFDQPDPLLVEKYYPLSQYESD